MMMMRMVAAFLFHLFILLSTLWIFSTEQWVTLNASQAFSVRATDSKSLTEKENFNHEIGGEARRKTDALE